LLAAAASGDVEALGPLLFNDLQEPVATRHPEIGKAVDRLQAAGALGAVMTGSGSSVVGLARDAEHAERLAGDVGALHVVGPASDGG
jgi:4-diphosphocytidyl-2-C-methyl-D-erythritol kinase